MAPIALWSGNLRLSLVLVPVKLFSTGCSLMAAKVNGDAIEARGVDPLSANSRLTGTISLRIENCLFRSRQ